MASYRKRKKNRHVSLREQVLHDLQSKEKKSRMFGLPEGPTQAPKCYASPFD